MLMRSALY